MPRLKFRRSYVYIIADKPMGRTYIGATENLSVRMYQFKNRLAKGFSKNFDLDKLVYFERVGHMGEAIQRSRVLKALEPHNRLRLVSEANPTWRDLYEEVIF